MGDPEDTQQSLTQPNPEAVGPLPIYPELAGIVFNGDPVAPLDASDWPQSKQHINCTPGVCGGKPGIAGTRVRVWDIAMRAQTGESRDKIIIDFPRLSLADIYAALACYHDNRKIIEEQAAEDDRFDE